MNRRMQMFSGTLCLLFLLWGCRTQPQMYLQIFSQKQDRVIREYTVCPGEEFYLEYIHSSEKTPIYDVFIVNDAGSLTLIEERFLWYAVGLEAHAEYGEAEIRFEGDETRVLLRRVFDPFSLRVGWIANQVFTVQDRELVLKDIAEPGDLLQFSIVQKP